MLPLLYRSAAALWMLAAVAAGCSHTPPASDPPPSPRVSAAQPPPVPMPTEPPAPSPWEVCETSTDYEACVARLERAAIEEAGGRVRREGARRLVITGADGSRLLLTDVSSPADHTIRYRYRDYLPEIGQHLLEIGYYEGGGFVLVDAGTTDQTFVIGPPVVSPERTRFAAASVDLEAGYDPNGLQVWRLTEAGPRLEWGLEGGDAWGASDPVWQSEDVVVFTRQERTDDPEHPEPIRMRLTLRERGLDLQPLRP